MRTRIWIVPAAVLITWMVFELSLLRQPMGGLRMHEAHVSRQIGRTARNHLILGLARTGGANVTCVRQDGSLVVHTSYSPLASWVTAIPLKLGVPFDTATRVTALSHVLIFLAGLWLFAYHLSGPVEANAALVFAAFSPILGLYYGRSCIFEILGLGPLMFGLALLVQPRRGAWVWFLVTISFLLAVMDSWIFWLVILPCLVREAMLRSSWSAVVAAVLVVVVPVAVHFATIFAASGDVLGFFRHVLDRASGHRGTSGEGKSISHYEIVKVFLERCRDRIGAMGLVSMILVLSRLVAGGWPGDRRFWYLVLTIYTLPLTLLMRNIAFHHEFFLILLVPLAALSTAWVCHLVADALPEYRPSQGLFWGGIFLAFFICDVYPARHELERGPESLTAARICDAIARIVDPGDFVILSPGFFFYEVPETREPLADREKVPLPTYCGQMVQDGFLAYDTADASRLATLARPKQRVVILSLEQDFKDHPEGFQSLPTEIPGFYVSSLAPRESRSP